MTKNEFTFGGVTTDPEMVKLDAHFDNLEEGQLIEYEEIAKVISCPYRSNRFRTVIYRWIRKVLRDRNVKLVNKRTRGYVVAAPEEWLDHDIQKHASLSTQQRRNAHDLTLLPRNRLSRQDQSRYDHAALVALRTAQASQEGSRELASKWKPVKSLPRPKAVK